MDFFWLYFCPNAEIEVNSRRSYRRVLLWLVFPLYYSTLCDCEKKVLLKAEEFNSLILKKNQEMKLFFFLFTKKKKIC